MNRKAIVCLAILSPLILIGCAGSSTNNNGAAVSEMNEVAATGTEQSLLAALNAERRRAGKAEIKVSPVLAKLAREESDAAAAAAQVPGNTTEALRARAGFRSISKLHGVLKDRGPQTGKSFVDYWVKDSREIMLDDWNMIGVGVSKAADGRLFAVVIMGGSGGVGGRGSSLMQPAMEPGGF